MQFLILNLKIINQYLCSFKIQNFQKFESKIKKLFKIHTMLLLTLLLLALGSSQLFKKVSNCLDSCLACQKYQPSLCMIKGQTQTCQQGYFYNQTSQKCQIKPAFQSNFTSLQFTEQTRTQNDSLSLTTWRQAKVSQCSYIDQSGIQKHFSAIGLFRQVHGISKQFEVSEHHEVYLFSFNLIRNTWMPHNDFLIVDLEAGTQLLGSYEISYDNRQGMVDQNLIVCNQQSVVAQKYTIKINKKSIATNNIKISFTGFLFTSVWGISNVKFIPGCEKFTVYNKLTGSCDFCNLGFFPVFRLDKNISSELIRCNKCPFQCANCLNQTYCTSCTRGYRLTARNVCVRNDDFSTIELNQYVNSELKICREMNQTFNINTQKSSIQSLNYKNLSKIAFGNISIVFEFVYNTKFQSRNGQVDIKVNGLKVNQIKTANLTNHGFQACSKQSLQRYSISKFTLALTNFRASSINISFQSNQCPQCRFGISNMSIIYVQNSSQSQIKLKGLRTFNNEKQATASLIPNKSLVVVGLPVDSLQTTSLVTAPQEQKEKVAIQAPQSKVLQSKVQQNTHQAINNTNLQKKTVDLTKNPTESQLHKQILVTDTQEQKKIFAIQAPQSKVLQSKVKQNTYQAIYSTNLQIKTVNLSKNSSKSQLNKQILDNETQTVNTNSIKTPTQMIPQSNNLVHQKQNIIPEKTSSLDSHDKDRLPAKNQYNSMQNGNKINTIIDHLAFSKNGNNGILIRLNNRTYSLPIQGSVLVMELSSTHKTQLQKGEQQKVLYKSIATSNGAPQIVSKQIHLEDPNTFTFYTDQTYLNDVVTIYAIKDKVKNQLTSFSLQRTDYLQENSQNVLSGFENLFQIFAWISILLVFISLLLGKTFLVEQSIQSAQFSFLGIYIFTSYLPASIVNTISGLRRLQNLDFFFEEHMRNLENFLLGDLVQNGPLRFSLFHKDINFIRSSLPLFLLTIIILVWFLALYCYKRKIMKADPQQNPINNQMITNYFLEDEFSFKNLFQKHICQQIVAKKLNYFIQVFKILFLPFMFISYKQFNNFSYPSGYSGEIFNMLFTLFVFIAFLTGAIALVFYCSNQYFKLEYAGFVSSLQALYFKKIPKNYLPTEHHRLVYPMFRYLKIFVFTLLVGLLGNYALWISIILILLNVGQIFYAWRFEIYQDSLHFKFFISESIMLSVLFLIKLILSQISGFISTSGYLSFGYVYMSIAIVIMLNGFARSGYLILDLIRKNKASQKDNRCSLGSQRIV